MRIKRIAVWMSGICVLLMMLASVAFAQDEFPKGDETGTMFIKQNNLAIRNAAADDAARLCAWWNDGAVMAHAGFPNGLGTTCEQVARDLARCSDEARRVLIIEADGVPIGEMSYSNMGDGVAEIGIKICDASQQGKGYGSQLITMLMNALFMDLEYEKVILDTNLNNARAQHVYEKLGFERLRVNENAWQDQLGRWQSSVDYEMTKARFAGLFKVSGRV